MPKKHSYYYIEQTLHNKSRVKILLGIFSVLFIGLIGVYYFGLTLAPAVLASNSQSINSKESDLKNQNKDFIVIRKLNLVLPFSKDKSNSKCDSGAWWQNSETGNPEKGGNFIISACRFELNLTPVKTTESSPFYNLNKIETGDEIEVYYKNNIYKYRVETKQTAPIDETKLTEESDTAKLTIFTSNPNGESDGKLALIALPKTETGTNSTENVKNGQLNILF